MKVAQTIEEIPELFESATREAIAAFGRGECFVEQYLDKARHVEAQVIADKHGNVVVAGTRDCSLQRRFQKLVEEAPAPFLTDDQRARIHASAKAICKEAGYYGAGTVEYRSRATPSRSSRSTPACRSSTRSPRRPPASTCPPAVPHRQRRGASIKEDPTPRGHSFEFRINGEDAGPRLHARPRPHHRLQGAHGPRRPRGLGVVAGDVIGGQFDSMLAKLIVTGENREQALQRAARALAEFEVDGLATVIRSTATSSRTPRSSATARSSTSTPSGSRPSGTTDRAVRRFGCCRGRRGETCPVSRSSSRSVAVASRSRCPFVLDRTGGARPA